MVPPVHGLQIYSPRVFRHQLLPTYDPVLASSCLTLTLQCVLDMHSVCIRLAPNPRLVWSIYTL
jgi:hypothetical protein